MTEFVRYTSLSRLVHAYKYPRLLCYHSNICADRNTSKPIARSKTVSYQEGRHPMSNPLDPTNLMPDTGGIHFHTAPPDLAFLFQRPLSGEDNERAQPLLTTMAAGAPRPTDK